MIFWRENLTNADLLCPMLIIIVTFFESLMFGCTFVLCTLKTENPVSHEYITQTSSIQAKPVLPTLTQQIIQYFRQTMLLKVSLIQYWQMHYLKAYKITTTLCPGSLSNFINIYTLLYTSTKFTMQSIQTPWWQQD